MSANDLFKDWATKPHKPYPSISANGNDSSVNPNRTSNMSRDDELEARDETEMAVLAIPLVVLTLMVILSNFATLITIHNYKPLRTNTFMFIGSLSMSDLLLGMFVMPFSVYATLSRGHWVLSVFFCNMYISMDVMLCTVSILQLAVICVDRFVAVQCPFDHIRLVNKKRLTVCIAILWILSFLIAFVPIFTGGNTLSGYVQNYDNPTLCLFDNSNQKYVLTVSCSTFFIPFLLMIGLYTKVMQIAKMQAKRINELSRYGTVAVSENGDHAVHSMPANDTKATKTLFRVLIVFAMCWLPYFICFSLKPFMNIHENLDYAVLWLGYANSAFNPLVYSLSNNEFRYGFLVVLLGKQKAAKYRTDKTDVVHL